MKLDVVYNKSCQRMDEVPDESIDMIMTSPPYWSLRNYGEDVKEVWGGDSDCEHSWGDDIVPKGSKSGPHGSSSTIGAKLGQDGARRGKGSNFCQKCGAWHGQVGLEPTLEMYIDHLLLITLECKRVLKPTGVMWWNHGDSYGGSGGQGDQRNTGSRVGKIDYGRKYPKGEITPKCLALQNYRLVIRMIDEQGWTLRNDAIWNKPNGMPSSVKDRLANKYEPVFCLVKNTKPRYYWNEKTALMADRKPPKDKQKENIDWDWQEVGIVGDNTFNVRVRDANTVRFLQGATEEEKANYGKSKLKKKSHWHSLGYWYDLDAIREKHKESSLKRIGKPLHQKHPNNIGVGIPPVNTERMGERFCNPSGKNPGDVWTIPTQPRPEAHFATFPDALCIKPILASCPSEICRRCGKPRVRITETSYIPSLARPGSNPEVQRTRPAQPVPGDKGTSSINKRILDARHQTIGWTDCGCDVGFEAGVVLDPFAGRGTALIMAKKLGRHYIGYELKSEYCEKLIKPALDDIDPLFKKVGLIERK